MQSSPRSSDRRCASTRTTASKLRTQQASHRQVGRGRQADRVGKSEMISCLPARAGLLADHIRSLADGLACRRSFSLLRRANEFLSASSRCARYNRARDADFVEPSITDEQSQCGSRHPMRDSLGQVGLAQLGFARRILKRSATNSSRESRRPRSFSSAPRSVSTSARSSTNPLSTSCVRC